MCIRDSLNADQDSKDELSRMFHLYRTDISYLENIEDQEIYNVACGIDRVRKAINPPLHVSAPDMTCAHKNIVESIMPVSGDRFNVCKDCKQEVEPSVYLAYDSDRDTF